MLGSVQNKTSFAWKLLIFFLFMYDLLDASKILLKKIYLYNILCINLLTFMYDFRPYDGAVIHSIATFGEYLFPPGKYHKILQSNALWGKGKWGCNYLIYISALW